MPKKIVFRPVKPEIAGLGLDPVPTIKCLPEWWKEHPSFSPIEEKDWDKSGTLPSVVNTILDAGQRGGLTIKKCPAILDVMSLGYIIKTPCDIIIKAISEDEYMYEWKDGSYSMIMEHSQQQVSNYHFPDEYLRIPLRFNLHWNVHTPKGYSTLFIPPMYHEDLPFRVFPGVIDTDKFGSNGPFPFLIRRGYEGIIEAGTPFVQAIPFKREEWEMEIAPLDEQQTLREGYAVKSVYQNGYRRNFWSRKSFK